MTPFLKRLFQFFASLRLTVACLGFGMLLIFLGTLAQVDLGLYTAQNKFFRSFFVYWQPHGADWRIPVLPGGYFVGCVLMANLVAAHYQRFKLTKKRAGIFLIHAGIILMLLGQLLTDVLSVETAMRLTEGEAKNFSESSLENELAIIDPSAPDLDHVISIPETLVAKQKDIRHAQLPFVVRVKQYYPNSHLTNRPPEMTGTAPAIQGLGTRVQAISQPITADPERRNLPSAIVELATDQGPLGTWLVSDWLSEPQKVQAGSKHYQIVMRPTRSYRPYHVELMKFTHEKYRGTEIPKNFASRIRLLDEQTKEDREVLIYMNNPLRYRGETYYQGSFDPEDPRVSILQVVRNPGWLTPYLSCVLVTLGLAVQFLSHLIPFIKRRIA